ncbi:MAG: class I SAM-dependent methyltransferase [Burkholderiaceae bacterium]
MSADRPTDPGPAPVAAASLATPAGAADDVPPHPVLSDYYGGAADRRDFVGTIFDETSPDYDRVERFFGLGTGSWYRRQALERAGLVRGMRVIDVGCGTGLVTREAVALAGDPARVIGVDPSSGMRAQARLPAGVRLIEGSGESIPLPDASGDFLSMGFALRHLSSLSRAFAEFHRVLAPGGRVCVLELTRPRGALATRLLRGYMRDVVPTVAGWFSRSRRTDEVWRYYWDTIEACVDPETVMRALREAGFADVRRHVEIGIFSEYTATRA